MKKQTYNRKKEEKEEKEKRNRRPETNYITEKTGKNNNKSCKTWEVQKKVGKS
jgi:hypothetical protein